jgi:hypothetical protein
VVPTILRWRGFRCFFYSNEGGEPPYVHVRTASGEVKIWLTDLTVAASVQLPPNELASAKRLVAENREALLEAWHDYFGNRRL